MLASHLNTDSTARECRVPCTLPTDWTAQPLSCTHNPVWANFGVGHVSCRCRLGVQSDLMMPRQEQETSCKGKASILVMPLLMATCFSSLIGPKYPGLRSDDALARARDQLQGQGKPTGDALAHSNLLQQSDRADIPWAARKLCLQL